MIRVVTANLNGIRSASSKGFFEWIGQQEADVVGIQEVKAQHEQVTGTFCHIGAMPGQFHYAKKRGYSGVGIYLKNEPTDVVVGLGDTQFDDEGRWVEARYDKSGRKLSIISCYFPSGSSGEERQQAKFRFLDLVYPKLLSLRQEREFILMGDVNIAHQQIDLKNWRSNQKNSGFLPEERDWMTKVLTEGGLVDVYRHLHPETTDECYTWWSNRGQAYANNVGWRLDYQIATPSIAATALRASIYKAQKFSDHAPLLIDYDFTI